MRQKCWRTWPVIAATVAILTVVTVYLAVAWLTREPPNYARIDDGLFLGGYVASPPPGTKAVLNLCETEDRYQVEVHRWEQIHDAEPVPTLAWLRRQVEFIDGQRQAGRLVFVHCQNGVSRSGMVVVAYVMWRDGWSRDRALAFVQSKRPMVRPNPAFMDLLLEWEKSLAAKVGG
jgi:hypothetical protein